MAASRSTPTAWKTWSARSLSIAKTPYLRDTTRAEKPGAHRFINRNMQDQRCRAIRLSQGHPRGHRRRPPPETHRWPVALELHDVNLKSPWGPAGAYASKSTLPSL